MIAISNINFYANQKHFYMKKKTFILIAAVLALSSCGNGSKVNKDDVDQDSTTTSTTNDYAQLVKQRIAEYTKAGKVIINSSDDPTGKEHFIVFADAQAQVIQIDTLGKLVQVINIQKLKETTLMLPMCQDYEPFTIFASNDYIEKKKLRITKSGKFKDRAGHLWDIKCYKDKYLTITRNDHGTKLWNLLFFKKPQIIYSGWGDVKSLNSTDGNLRLTLTSTEEFFGNQYKDMVNCIYHVTFDNAGNIMTQDDYVNYGGINIPITAFGDADALQPYIERIANNL